jgi:hypothetical protein
MLIVGRLAWDGGFCFFSLERAIRYYSIATEE